MQQRTFNYPKASKSWVDFFLQVQAFTGESHPFATSSEPRTMCTCVTQFPLHDGKKRNGSYRLWGDDIISYVTLALPGNNGCAILTFNYLFIASKE